MLDGIHLGLVLPAVFLRHGRDLRSVVFPVLSKVDLVSNPQYRRLGYAAKVANWLSTTDANCQDTRHEPDIGSCPVGHRHGVGQSCRHSGKLWVAILFLWPCEGSSTLLIEFLSFVDPFASRSC